MMKRIALLLVLFLSLTTVSLAQTATVTGHILSPAAGATGTGKVCFTLQGYKPNVPRVIGSGIVIQQTNFCVVASPVDGSFSTSLFLNTAITPSGTWRVDYLWNGIQQSSGSYFINSSPFNLDVVQPLVSSPTVSSQVVGAQSYPFTQSTPSTSWVINHKFNDLHPMVACYDLVSHELYPDSVVATDANDVTVTFASPNTGVCNVISAGYLNVAPGVSNSIVSNPIGPQAVAGTLAVNQFNCISFENEKCVDAANSQNWAGSEYAAWINSAIASLPTTTVNGTAYPIGTIRLYAIGSPFVVNQTVPVVITSPFVSIIGPGSSLLQFNCSINGDCWNIHETPFNNSHGGSRYSGFTIVGQGSSNANAVGIHTGDLQAGQWTDIKIDNFTGTNSSCFWVDIINGWFERNIITDLELGVHQTSAGIAQNGCTKELRFTQTGTFSSFGYNEWFGVRFSINSGQTGISLDSGFLYNGNFSGNANMSGGTLFAINHTGDMGEGTYIDLRAEATTAIRWSVPNGGTTFTYFGPGLVTGWNDNLFSDSVVATSSVTRVLNAEYGTHSLPAASGNTTLWIPGYTGINEMISIDSNPTNSGGGFGSVNGANIAHPIVWGYSGDTNCFEAYIKGYQTPLTSSNRIATLSCSLGNSSSNFVLDNATQTLTNKTLTSPALTTPTIGGGSTINSVYRASAAALNSAFTSITAGTCQEQTITLTGATTSGSPFGGPTAALGTGFNWQFWVSAVNTVTVRVCAGTTGTPNSVTWNVGVIQ